MGMSGATVLQRATSLISVIAILRNCRSAINDAAYSSGILWISVSRRQV